MTKKNKNCYQKLPGESQTELLRDFYKEHLDKPSIELLEDY